MNQFYKGRTNNHLTWVMVDATDFASPESAVSAATTIKIYGKLRGAAGVNFVSSGTGSLTNDITHVGASATGIYSIGLAKADLSDASAAWYDQYVITLSATGCARQTLVVDGGIDASAISAYQSRLSDLASYLVAMSGMLSDTHSAAILAASNASEAQSNALLIQSRLSDFNSAYASDISDLLSQLLVIQSVASDAHSAAVVAQALGASDLSDLRSAIAAGPAATITASDISDIVSAVWAAKYTAHSAASSFGSLFSDVYSRVVLIQSMASDAHSAAILAASHASDAHSAAVVAQGLNASDLSDIRSAIAAGPAATVTASDISDIASAVNAILASLLSDIYSAVSNINSATVAAPDTSDFASAVWSEKYTGWTAASSFGSAVRLNMSRISDLQSQLTLVQSTASDIYSLLSDVSSDLTVISGIQSDIYSALLAPGASFTSDIASAVWAFAGADPTTVPAATGTMGAKMNWLTALSRNKITQNSAVQSLRNDADAADIASATVADDGTTFTRGKFA